MTHTHTHTPGSRTRLGSNVNSWRIEFDATYCEGNRLLHGVDHDETVPDSMETHGQGWDEAEANARLISSAPDLLAALQVLMHGTRKGKKLAQREEARATARAAIAKATGKGGA